MSIFNPELLKFARQHVQEAKRAFIDPAMAGGGGGGAAGAAGADPMAAPMPPMPAMGMDPAAAGGAPPGGDPAAGGAPPIPDAGAPAGGDSVSRAEFDMLMQKVDQALAGGGAGAGKGEKMKVDVNTEIYHIKKLLTQIAGELGMKIPPQMLLGDPAMDPEVPPEQAAQDPHSVAASQGSAIGPIEPVGAASPALAAGGGAGGGGGGEAPKSASAEPWNVDTAQAERGQEVPSGLVQQSNKAAALAAQLRHVNRSHTRAA